jgi:hypothetical protein
MSDIRDRWPGDSNPRQMLIFLEKIGISDRKLRLFNCACVRQVWQHLGDSRSRQAVEMVERFADGDEGADLSVARYQANRASWQVLWKPGAIAAAEATYPGVWKAAEFLTGPRDTGIDLFGCYRNPHMQAALLRDVADNAVLPRPISAGVVTPQILELAQAAYSERDPASGYLDPLRLQVLADAMEETGCTYQEVTQIVVAVKASPDGWQVSQSNRVGKDVLFSSRRREKAVAWAEKHMGARSWNKGPRCWHSWSTVTKTVPHPLLAHLRACLPHVRGCWALDLVLGKE